MSSLAPTGYFIPHRIQQSHCSSTFHQVLPSDAVAFSASQFKCAKNPHEFIGVCTPEGFEFTEVTDTRLENNLIRHYWGDRLHDAAGTLPRFYSLHILAQIYLDTEAFLPCPLNGERLLFFRHQTSALPSPVDRHRITPTHAASRYRQLIKVSSTFFCANILDDMTCVRFQPQSKHFALKYQFDVVVVVVVVKE